MVPNSKYINSHPHSITTVDLNNDDRLDLVVANSNTNNIGIFIGYGKDTFADQITYPTGIDSPPY
jgi:hypothetical protein